MTLYGLVLVSTAFSAHFGAAQQSGLVAGHICMTEMRNCRKHGNYVLHTRMFCRPHARHKDTVMGVGEISSRNLKFPLVGFSRGIAKGFFQKGTIAMKFHFTHSKLWEQYFLRNKLKQLCCYESINF